MFKRVVTAIDGSEESADAADVAASLATSIGAELVVVHAVGLLEEQAVHGVAIEDRGEEIERTVEEVWCRRLRERGVAHRVELLPGSPVPAILTAIDRLGADLIVVGSRGTGARGVRQLGSTSQQLAAESPVPVLVVPPLSAEAARGQ